MNQKVLKTLEYTKIIDMLTEKATCEAGKEQCRRLKPMTDLSEIRTAQQETTDALVHILRKGSLSFSGVKEIRPSLKRLDIGGTLSQIELLHICGLLENANRVKQYSRQENVAMNPDSLTSYFDGIEPLTVLSGEIRRCILSEDEISDDASPNLHQIRRNMRNINDRIHDQIHGMVNNATTRTYLQEAVVTQRNGRYCLPVKAEYRSKIQGMIHDQSSTGSTLFIEPMSIVKLNNDYKELLLKEQEEIDVILATLSASTAEHIPSIEADYRILSKLDFIFAKAQLSRQYKGNEPTFNTEHYIEIIDGKHPLLDPHKVVPITVRLGGDYDLLIVTGPNTGGKTVSIKTVGLFTLMGQSGLHIPAHEKSSLSVFEEVYADIGDEQSIEQSLSTFSSHMTNITGILGEVNENSLVLFDELGAGTDPTEGAALATSILSYLHNRGIRTMATTHYSELKVYALSTDGVENASCEFDVETLRPTYRLLIGIPGKSNAFAIAGKLGIPDIIIEDAKDRISAEAESFEDVIADLEASRRIIEDERAEIREYKLEIKELKERLQKKNEKIEKRTEDIIREANEKANAILSEAKEYADQTLRDFRKFAADNENSKEMDKKRQALQGKIKDVQGKMAMKAPKKPKKQLSVKDLKGGERVRIISMGLEGNVISVPNSKGNVLVQTGIIRTQTNINDLEIIDEPVITAPNLTRTGSGKIKMSKSASVSTEINLIGKTVDEALALLDKYLDDAYLAHLPSVRVVHGKGTGKLRSAVHSHLKRMKYVKSFRLGEFGEGDAGVTIVEFK